MIRIIYSSKMFSYSFLIYEIIFLIVFCSYLSGVLFSYLSVIYIPFNKSEWFIQFHILNIFTILQ